MSEPPLPHLTDVKREPRKESNFERNTRISVIGGGILCLLNLSLLFVPLMKFHGVNRGSIGMCLLILGVEGFLVWLTIGRYKFWKKLSQDYEAK